MDYRGPPAWSPDGTWLVHHRRSGLTPGLFAETLFAAEIGSQKSHEPVAQCRGGVADQARFSPDGRWLAYNCDESGRCEIYVVPFRHEADRVRVSVDGGMQPAWRADQRELFFLAPDGALMASTVTASADAINVGRPTALFGTPLRPTYQSEQYAPLAVDRGFILRVPTEGSDLLRFVMNWSQRITSPAAR